jgi:hypothetical protein
VSKDYEKTGSPPVFSRFGVARMPLEAAPRHRLLFNISRPGRQPETSGGKAAHVAFLDSPWAAS